MSMLRQTQKEERGKKKRRNIHSISLPFTIDFQITIKQCHLVCPIHACTAGVRQASETECAVCAAFVGHKLQTNRSCSFSTRLTYNSKLNAGCVSGICVYRSSAAATPSNCHERKKAMQSTSFGAQSIKPEWKAFSRFFCSAKVANVTHLATFTRSFCVGEYTTQTHAHAPETGYTSW